MAVYYLKKPLVANITSIFFCLATWQYRVMSIYRKFSNYGMPKVLLQMYYSVIGCLTYMLEVLIMVYY